MGTIIFWGAVLFCGICIFYCRFDKAFLEIEGFRKIGGKFVGMKFDNDSMEIYCKHIFVALILTLAVYIFLSFLLFFTDFDVSFNIHTGLRKLLGYY